MSKGNDNEFIKKRRERLAKRGPSQFSKDLLKQAETADNPFERLMLLWLSLDMAERDDVIIEGLR